VEPREQQQNKMEQQGNQTEMEERDAVELELDKLPQNNIKKASSSYFFV